MGFVFISYSRKDTKTVDHIVSRLKSDGFEVWIDRANIKGGDLWTVAIVEAIDTADSFVLMLSPNSTTSDNVRKEVQLAQDAKRKLFPLLIAAVTLPPQFRYQLAGIQLLDYSSDPETKYRELVEVLDAHRQTLIRADVPTTRVVEVVISQGDAAKFNAAKRDRLLDTVARIAETARTKLTLTKLTAGSVHAFIEMPAHAAYVLKTAALNKDKRLLNYGIDALRLDGEENFVSVHSGEIGPLDLPKQRPPFYKGFLLSIIGLGIVAAMLFALLPGAKVFFQPSPTPTFTSTPTLTVTPSETPTPSKTSTPTRTYTPSPTPNVPPPAPEILSPSNDLRVECASVRRMTLDWNEPYDENGIGRYRVILDVYINEQWSNVFDLEVPGDTTELDITKEFLNNCGNWMSWRVQAMDRAGDWGAWSEKPVFLGETIQIVIPLFNVPPPAPEIVSPKHETSVFCNSGAVFLDWQAVRDINGITRYEVELYQSIKNEWVWLWTLPVDGSMTELDITKEVNIYCGSWLSWRVRAQDGLGDWGDWSSQPMFWTQPVPQ